MPTETAATVSMSVRPSPIRSSARFAATTPEMPAQRVPPSALSTVGRPSQACARRARPCRRPPALHGRSAAGSPRFDPSACSARFAWSALAGGRGEHRVLGRQPTLPAPIQRGTPSSSVAVQRTRVRPSVISASRVFVEVVRLDRERRSVGPAAAFPLGHAAASKVDTSTCSTSPMAVGETALERPECARLAGREEAVHAFAPGVVLDPLASERLGDLMGRLFGREDQRHTATEDPLEDRHR